MNENALPAGLVDNNWEIFANGNSLYIIFNGSVLGFSNWPNEVFSHFRREMHNTPGALREIEKMGITGERNQVWQYCYCRYGGFDNVPDYDPKTKKTQAEKWDCGRNCQGILCGRKQNHGLTKRQSEIVNALVSGKPDKQVCEDLFIAPGTLRTHKLHIFKTLGVHSKTELSRFAYQNGLVRI